MNEKTRFDVIIPVAKKDISFVPRVVDYVTRCLSGVSMIFILTSKRNIPKLVKALRGFLNCTILDEDELAPSLSYGRVGALLLKIAGNRDRTGWYLQQFLKYGFAQSKYANKYYLSWDADTLPLAPISFFEDNHILYNPKSEYNPNYFKTIEKIFGFGKVNNKSFISENMMFSVEMVKHLIADVNAAEIKGNDWIEKILYACDFADPLPAFSEFETYGSYCCVKNQGLYKERHLNTFREAGMISGRFISERRLRLMSFDIDMASFEEFHQPLFPYNIAYLFRKNVDRVCKIVKLPISEVIAKIMRKIKKKDKEAQKVIERTMCRLPGKQNNM